MTFEDGESAVSHGPMVPVAGTPDEATARAVVAVLDAHHIPAILDREIEGAYIPRAVDNIGVLVPMSMLGKARSVLSRDEGGLVRVGGSSSRRAPMNPPQERALPERMSAESSSSSTWTEDPFRRERPPIADDVEIDLDDDEDDLDALDVVLPEPSSLNTRLSIAIAAIAIGAGTQRILEALWRDDVRGAFAARWDRLFVEPWRLVTAGFVHGGPSHYISNALFGVMIGVVLFGTHRVGATAFVWVFSSAVGLFAESLLSPAAWIVGASAGNYGLVGLWAHGQLERSRVSTLPRRERLRTVGVLLLLVPGALTPFSSTGTKIAIMAHAAGFVAGFLAGYPFSRRLRPEDFSRIDIRSRVAGVLAFAIVVGAVTWAAAVYG